MSVYVFLGPTLPVEEARRILDAHYLPPVAMGDVYNLLARKPRAIVIVDGLFEQTPAVWHKEILFALCQGVRVFGGSSMGALRAAELHAFGMEGVGRIFEGFLSGEYQDDDEVTIAHAAAESGYRPLSDAMVNLRLGLRLAEERGLISAGSNRALLAAAKEIFYPERSWSSLVEAGARLGVPREELDALLAFARREKPDQKRQDAEELLRHVSAERARGMAPHQHDFQFEPTLFWVHLTETAARAAPPGSLGGPSYERLRNHLRLCEPGREDLQRAALLLFLVHREAQRAGLAVESMAPAVQRFRRTRRLLSSEAMNDWLRRNRLTPEECGGIAQTEALCGELMRRYAAEIDGFLATELQLRGRFGDVVETVEQKWRCLEERGATNPTLAETGATIEEVLAWYQKRHGPVYTDLEAHARDLGFGSKRQFLTELFAEYVFAHAEQPCLR